MMSLEKQSLKYHDSQVLNSQMLELSYFSKDLSLILVLPKKQNGLERLKTVFTSDNFFPEIKKLRGVYVDIHLPKFVIEKNYDLKLALSKSLSKVFSNDADFSRINGKKDLKISKFLHKVIIEINENGSEAAAGSGASLDTKASGEVESVIFRADHPFIYLIVDKRDNLILFMGQINKLGSTEDPMRRQFPKTVRNSH
jgi:serpin B